MAIAEAVPVTAEATADLGELAGRVFDYHAEHPHLARLLHWEALKYGGASVPNERARTAVYRQKVESIVAAQRAGLLPKDFDAAHLLFFVIAVASWWFAVPQLVRTLTGNRTDGRRERAQQRAAVVAAARRLAEPAAERP